MIQIITIIIMWCVDVDMAVVRYTIYLLLNIYEYNIVKMYLVLSIKVWNESCISVVLQ